MILLLFRIGGAAASVAQPEAEPLSDGGGGGRKRKEDYTDLVQEIYDWRPKPPEVIPEVSEVVETVVEIPTQTPVNPPPLASFAAPIKVAEDPEVERIKRLRAEDDEVLLLIAA